MTPLERGAQAVMNIMPVLSTLQAQRVARAVMNSIDEQELGEVIRANTYLADSPGDGTEVADLIKDYLSERQSRV